jgi:hypothetical protein
MMRLFILYVYVFLIFRQCVWTFFTFKDEVRITVFGGNFSNIPTYNLDDRDSLSLIDDNYKSTN